MGSEPLAVLLLAFLLTVVVCTSGHLPLQIAGAPETPALPGPAGITPVNPPSVRITYPDFDGSVGAGNVTVTILVRNFSVASIRKRENAAGEGHLACFMDVVPPVTPGYPAVTVPGTFQLSYRPWCTLHNVSPGTHTFIVERVHNDGTPPSSPHYGCRGCNRGPIR